MKDERLLITWKWFRDNWCMYQTEIRDTRGILRSTICDISFCTHKKHRCQESKCSEWHVLKLENATWLSDTKEIENISTWARYTVQRLSKDEKFYGSIHYSIAGHTTLCNQHVDEKWYIKTTDFKGLATCKKCIKVQEEASNNG